MTTVEVWETIRIRCRRDGEGVTSVARELGITPNTMRKYLRQAAAPKRKPMPRAGILERYRSHVDGLILATPKITAARISTSLRQNVDADLVVSERTLRVYVASRRAILVPRESFIRTADAAGQQSQFDFLPMSVRLAGVAVVVRLFVLRLSIAVVLRHERRCAVIGQRCSPDCLLELRHLAA